MAVLDPIECIPANETVLKTTRYVCGSIIRILRAWGEIFDLPFFTNENGGPIRFIQSEHWLIWHVSSQLSNLKLFSKSNSLKQLVTCPTSREPRTAIEKNYIVSELKK